MGNSKAPHSAEYMEYSFGYASYELPSAGLRAIKWEASDDFVIQVMPNVTTGTPTPAGN